ncbi:hypothetical protein B0A55_04796 [Friedmanniomyces simplex]|uniref:Protein kinase domain-containing protein n=1 Tax=Friedmanniomyces simplex TaxID=329884 RepID=A0A4U0XJU5_9PEZI|nr:hypothetical protein B0A55_04796 [Friedmanniomyces simplex]
MGDVQVLRRRIHELRVENADARKFVPENALVDVITRETIRPVVSARFPLDSAQEVTNTVLKGGRKIFSILVTLDNVGCIQHFIKRDQLQARPIDSLLPFTEIDLRDILKDEYIADCFYEAQWGFCAPVFTRKTIPRTFDRHVVLPFLRKEWIAAGAYGAVYKIDIHPDHRPVNSDTATEFVRKEIALGDGTYDNEVRILSTMQCLDHPNILKLLACYTHNDQHNIISPYISQGTLRKYLQQEKRTTAHHSETFHLIAGLASAVWAMHEFVMSSDHPAHKGHHDDLRPDNVLYDGSRLILADFGLSSLKASPENSNTTFKGRQGYYQAPECAELGHPYNEHGANRASDIFAFGCMIADIVVHLAKGPSGVREFQEARTFRLQQITFHLFHKGDRPNDAVAAFLEQTARDFGSPVFQDIVRLINTMLDTDPKKRPLARHVTTKLYDATIAAFVEQSKPLFANLKSSPHAVIEHARFRSWRGSFDASYYFTLPRPTTAAAMLESIVDTLRQMKQALEDIDLAIAGDCRTFLDIRRMNTELINSLPEAGRAAAETQISTIILKMIRSDPDDAVYDSLRTAFGDSRISRLADAKRRILEVEGSSTSVADVPCRVLSSSSGFRLRDRKDVGPFKLARIHDESTVGGRLVLEEVIKYHEKYRRQKLLPRLSKLAELLASPNLPSELRVPPFYGLHDNVKAASFGLLYDLAEVYQGDPASLAPKSLHQLLSDRNERELPDLERRYSLASDLAEALAALHDLEWFHKDLSSHSVLFLPTSDRQPYWKTQPYLIGFHHSRQTREDFSEGPLTASQDRSRERYHDPEYLSKDNGQFRRFRPEFDYYSLGILLLEIASWTTIGAIMSTHASEDYQTFAMAVIEEKLTGLQFSMGSVYAAVVEQCLTGLKQSGVVVEEAVPITAQMNLAVRKTITGPLRTLRSHSHEEDLISTAQKRKADDGDELPVTKRWHM